MLFAEFDMEAELAAEREAGWEAGQEIGRKERDIEIAKNALTEGISSEFVRKITGLDLETLRELSSQ